MVFPKNLRDAVCKSKLQSTLESKMYTVCPHDECSALYDASDDIKCCTQNNFGKVCGSPLGYEANLAHGRRKWKAYKKFQFYPPSSWLRMFFSSKEFLALLKHRIKRVERADFLEDVYDGRIWKAFSDGNFFNTKYNIGLMLNTDWFKPFKRSEYKVAAIMLTVLNLPREERFKKKWTIIAGILLLLV